MSGIHIVITPTLNTDNIIQTPSVTHAYTFPDEPVNIVNTFMTEYYGNVSNIGWNAVQHLFDHNCTVFTRDKIVGNETDLLNTLSYDFIKRAEYFDIRHKWIILNNSILITVFGSIQFVYFSEIYSMVFPFSETFLLNMVNGTIKCTHHVFEF